MPAQGTPKVAITGNGDFDIELEALGAKPGLTFAVSPDAGGAHGGFTVAFKASDNGRDFFTVKAFPFDGATAESGRALGANASMGWFMPGHNIDKVRCTVTNWVSGSAEFRGTLLNERVPPVTFQNHPV
jgi:hypothetical protein